MKSSHKLTSLLSTLLLLAAMSVMAIAADPGSPVTFNIITSEAPANLLVYNLYSSSLTNPVLENTRISITNVSDIASVSVHFYFIDGSNCSVADSYVCLTQNQTTTFYASDIDPGVTGYIIAIATDENGLPLRNALTGGRLLGDEQVKLASGHMASLQAQAIPFIFVAASPAGDAGAGVTLFVPRVLALSNIASPADGNNQLVVVNRLGGDLRLAMGSIGSIFGILYDQLENSYSYSFSGGCQFRRVLGGSFPRTTPRINNVIPAASVGWTKFWGTANVGITGAVLNQNSNIASSSTAFGCGHNLQVLTFTTEALIFPIFPSNCGFVTTF